MFKKHIPDNALPDQEHYILVANKVLSENKNYCEDVFRNLFTPLKI